MKKEQAVEELDRIGQEINGLYASAWNTTLHPTQYGWARSIVSAATIPVLSFASIGQMVGSAVVRQVSPDLIEKVTEFPTGGGRKD